MIVKLVARPKSGTSFARLAKYIIAEKTAGENVLWTAFTNVHADSLPDAVDEISCTQQLNQSTRANATEHMVVSFPIGESPDKEVLEDIEQALMHSISMSDHQRVSAAHNDTSHLHLHVAINKIDPVTHANVSPSFSKLKLQTAARAIEKKHGLQSLYEVHSTPEMSRSLTKSVITEVLADPACTWEKLQSALAAKGVRLATRGRGLVVTDRQGRLAIKLSSISRDLARGKLEHKLGPFVDHRLLPGPPVSTRARGMEVHSGLMSFSAWAREALCDVTLTTLADPACTWEKLQSALAAKGVRLATRGRGLVVTDRQGRLAIKLSSISRDLGRGKLEHKLGPFVDCGIPISDCAYDARPNTVPAQGLYSVYQEIRDARMANRKSRFQEYALKKDQALSRLRDAYRTQREAIWAEQGIDKRRRWLLMLQLKTLKAKEETKLKTEFAMARAKITRETHTGTWAEYLITQTNSGSASALRALRASQPARGDKPDIPGTYLSGKLRSPDQIISALPPGSFRAQKNGDIVIKTRDEERVILRANRLYSVGHSAVTRQAAREIAGNLFFGQTQMSPGVP